jgi:hypothetical protein
MKNDLPKYDSLPPLSPAHKPPRSILEGVEERGGINVNPAGALSRPAPPQPYNPTANIVDRQDAAWAKMLKPVDIKRVSCCEYLGLSEKKIDLILDHKPEIDCNSKLGLPSVMIKIEPKPLNDCELSGWKELIKNHKPTPTISQMKDRHARQVFADKAEHLINKYLAFFLTGLAILFVGWMMYKMLVWGE